MTQIPSSQKFLSDSRQTFHHSWWPPGDTKWRGLPQESERSCKVASLGSSPGSAMVSVSDPIKVFSSLCLSFPLWEKAKY